MAEAFSRMFAPALGGVHAGPGLEEGVQMDPLVHEATRRKVAALAEDAVARGGRLLTGRAAERIDSGRVGIQRGGVSDPSGPLGGWQPSAIGREGGQIGLLDHLETPCIALDWR